MAPRLSQGASDVANSMTAGGSIAALLGGGDEDEPEAVDNAAEEAAESAPTSQAELGEHPDRYTVQRMLTSMPKTLGPYAQELQEALQQGGPAFGAAMLKLNKDPEFGARCCRRSTQHAAS